MRAGGPRRIELRGKIKKGLTEFRAVFMLPGECSYARSITGLSSYHWVIQHQVLMFLYLLLLLILTC